MLNIRNLAQLIQISVNTSEASAAASKTAAIKLL